MPSSAKAEEKRELLFMKQIMECDGLLVNWCLMLSWHWKFRTGCVLCAFVCAIIIKLLNVEDQYDTNMFITKYQLVNRGADYRDKLVCKSV